MAFSDHLIYAVTYVLCRVTEGLISFQLLSVNCSLCNNNAYLTIMAFLFSKLSKYVYVRKVHHFCNELQLRHTRSSLCCRNIMSANTVRK